MYGTVMTFVRAPDEEAAFDSFCAARFAQSSFGRYVPPSRDEVTVRRPTEADRAWIEDSGNPAFLALLDELVRA